MPAIHSDIMAKIWDTASVLDRMRTLCSVREYCSSDIKKKALTLLDGNTEDVQMVLESLINDGYIDDMRYCSAYARDKSSISGWGTAKIRYMLSGKGMPEEVIRNALAEIDEEKAGNRLEKLLMTRNAAMKDDPLKKQKLIRYALGRGYTYDAVIAAIDKIRRNNTNL